MPTLQQVPAIRRGIESRIAAKAIPLKISDDHMDDSWLTVVVVPTRDGLRASEYADFMSEVERELRSEGYDEVVLVPALLA